MDHAKDGPERLKRWREANKISLRTAAAAFGVSHVVFRQWETGDLTPHVDMRRAIAVWTRGDVAEDAWPVSEREHRVVEAASRVVPYEAPAPKAGDTGSHPVADVEKAG